MQRYFINEAYQKNDSYLLQGDSVHHIVRVMRMAVGEQIYIVFTDQVSILAEITELGAEAVRVKEIARETLAKELPALITIASGFPKGDKLDLVVQKGTELGAHRFIAFPSKTSVVKWDVKKLQKKQQRLTKIAQEAAEQAQRQWQPAVQLLASYGELLAELAAYDVVIVAYEEAAKVGEQAVLAQTLAALQPGVRVLALFGPEGGFVPAEIAEFQEWGAVICGLGPRILRTETAPLYLLSAASYQLELSAAD